MKTVLVTGATGHLGGALVHELSREKGVKIRIFVLPSERLGGLDGAKVEIVCGDICNYSKVAKAVAGCDAVFHLASVIAVSASKKEEKLIWDVNVGGTRNVVRACRAQGIGRLLYVSSSSIFSTDSEVVTEESDFDVRCKQVYEQTKRDATEIVRQSHAEGLDTIIVYPTAIIGPHDTRGSLFGRLVKFVTKPYRTVMPLMKCGYDFVDVRDVAKGLVAAWLKGESGDEYILSGGSAPMTEVVKMLTADRRRKIRFAMFPIPFVKIGAWFAEFFGKLFRKPAVLTRYSLKILLSKSHFSNAKAVRRLGFKPRPLRDTIRDTVQGS